MKSGEALLVWAALLSVFSAAIFLALWLAQA